VDAKGWVVFALERLGWAGEREIQRFLDESGEELSRDTIERALSALMAEGRVERKGELFRLRPKGGGREAFERLFGDG